MTGRKRYDNMQQHTGEHILSGLVHRFYGYENVGFHMGAEEVTVDFNGMITADGLDRLEDAANQIVYDNVPVHTLYPAKEELASIDYRSKKELSGQVRIIEIPGRGCLRLLRHPHPHHRTSGTDQNSGQRELQRAACG